MQTVTAAASAMKSVMDGANSMKSTMEAGASKIHSNPEYKSQSQLKRTKRSLV